MRIKRLLGALGKDDALYQGEISTYAQLVSECQQIPEKVARIDADREALEELRGVIEEKTYNACCHKLDLIRGQWLRALDRKRGMMRSIEDRNMMTVKAAELIAEPEAEHRNPLLDILRNQQGGPAGG